MNDFFADNIITILAVLFVFEVLMGMLAQSIAGRKGHSKRWFWAGFLLSVVGAVWAAGLTDETLREQLRHLAELRAREAAPVFPAQQESARKPTGADEAELAAVLAAAAAAMGGEEGRKYVLRSFRPADGLAAWGRADGKRR